MRLAFIKRRSLFNLLISVGEILIIPDIIIIVSFNISSFFLRFLNLSTSRPLHHLAYLLISKLLKQFVFLLELLVFQVAIFIICIHIFVKVIFLNFLILIILVIKACLLIIIRFLNLWGYFFLSLLILRIIIFYLLLCLKILWMRDLQILLL
jgi:hypothetical protein